MCLLAPPRFEGGLRGLGGLGGDSGRCTDDRTCPQNKFCVEFSSELLGNVAYPGTYCGMINLIFYYCDIECFVNVCSLAPSIEPPVIPEDGEDAPAPVSRG